jgi:signal transduction histidine kinase
VALVNDVPADIVLSGDETALQQIVINLTTNAIKFTPSGGTIRWTGVRDDAGMLTLAVADTGAGISPDDIERVFEAFGQGRHDIATRERGTGLGLPIVRGLMRAHGGDVQIDSQLGQGTRVTLTFPNARRADGILQAA